MKDHISNCSSPRSTHSNSRFYILTGKGGVGKTSLAISLALKLKKQGRKVLLTSFSQKLDEQLIEYLGLDLLLLDVESSAKRYITKKLKSKSVATLILKAPLFISLINLVPSLEQMILMGDLISRLEDDPSLVIVMDSPSSGHALSMFQAPFHYKEMFKTGILVQDIDHLLGYIKDKNLFKFLVTAIPTHMAIAEGLELQKEIDQLGLGSSELILNTSMVKAIGRSQSKLPAILESKIDLEKLLFEKHKKEICGRVAFIPETDTRNRLLSLCNEMEQFI